LPEKEGTVRNSIPEKKRPLIDDSEDEFGGAGMDSEDEFRTMSLKVND
jgi:hypothetical protein